MNWFTPIRYIPMVGPVYAKKLEKLEIFTAGDLMLHLPSRYENYSLVSKINQLQEGEFVTVIGNIIEAKNVYTKFRKQIQTVKIKDESGTIEAVWFNQPFLINTFKAVSQLALAGKISTDRWEFKMQSPDYEIVKPDKPLIHSGRLVPIYPETAGVSSKWLRSRIYPLFNTELTREFLPKNIIVSEHLLNLNSALQNIHFPNNLNEINPARFRLAFDELLTLQLQAQYHRKHWKNQKLIHPFEIDEIKIWEFISHLPFRLTQAQKKSLQQILEDLKSPRPMNRLLEGDVGSGKTVVAAITMYATYLNNYQSVLMAPTEILAEQHFVTLKSLLEPFNIKVSLITSSNKLKTINYQLSTNILVGTHALLEDKIQLNKIKLVIIDEQHRFGVKQRALLRQKGETPHVLTMTATPIPRTVALAAYGDLDLSVIDEMPIGRKQVKTWVVPPQKRKSAYKWIKKQIVDSKFTYQAFIVCPFIEISETIKSVKAATEEYDYLAKEVFPDLKLGLLHGGMTSKQKNRVLSDFRFGKFSILVCTPVVEVGIDIPQATIMLIEAAERFGLAQLHQLRGRVGRSDSQSYCLLFTTYHTESNVKRLKNMEKALSGSELAEIDLKIRGPGQLYGTAQHGKQGLKIASYSDTELIESTQKIAKQLIDADQKLTAFPLLKQRVLSGTIQDIIPD